MKSNISRLLLVCAAACSVALTSCNDADYDVIDNQAYIAQTNTNGNSSKKITVGNDSQSAEFNVRVSSPVNKDCTFGISVDEAALKTYNETNSTAYELLPASQYTLSATDVTVAKGEATSMPVTLTVKPFTEELKNSGKKFAVPVKITSKDGTGVINSGSTLVYVIDQVIFQPVPTINASNNVQMTMRQDYDLTEWTLEFNVNIDKLGKSIGELNNQALFGAWGSNGGEIYTRFGDAPIEGDLLQIKTQGSQMNSNTHFNANTWYHVAFVCTGTKLYLYINGVLDNSMDLGGKVTNIAHDNVKFGNTDYLRANVKVSELRFWTVARQQAEIANNMYVIDPTTNGLEAYWKMNEGTGNDFKDATGHGNLAHAVGTTEWTQNVRIDGKE